MTVNEAVKETKGKFFKVVFTKADGTIREMICRTGVYKYLKGGDRKAPKENIVVYDVQSKGYRSFKPESVLSFQCGQIKF